MSRRGLHSCLYDIRILPSWGSFVKSWRPTGLCELSDRNASFGLRYIYKDLTCSLDGLHWTRGTFTHEFHWYIFFNLLKFRIDRIRPLPGTIINLLFKQTRVHLFELAHGIFAFVIEI